MVIVCISDTHGVCRAAFARGELTLPTGDVLVHAGDLSMRGTADEIEAELRWLAELSYPHKIVIAGNHDFAFEQGSAPRLVALCQDLGLRYLEDSATTIDGVTFWGSPWQPWFYDWAFNLQRGPEIRARWQLIPAGTHVVVTHGSPAGFGGINTLGEDVGCADLADELIQRVRPRLHVCGHIHEGYGRRAHLDPAITFVNASTVDLDYHPINPPVLIEL